MSAQLSTDAIFPPMESGDLDDFILLMRREFDALDHEIIREHQEITQEIQVSSPIFKCGLLASTQAWVRMLKRYGGPLTPEGA